MKKLFLLLFAASLAFVSCSDDDSHVTGTTETIVGFSASALSKSYLNDQTDAELQIPITLISYADEQLPSSDITLNWEIVVDNSADAAQAGVEYDLPAGGSGTAVIPAGETFSSISMNVHPTTFDPVNPKKVTLKITSASNSIVGEQYSKIVVTLQGVCASNLEGNYDLVVTRSDGTVYNLPGEVIAKLSDAQYKTNSTGPYNSRGLYGGGAQISGVGIVFDDVCNSISLWKDPDWSDQGDTGINPGQAQGLGPYYNPVYQTQAQMDASNVDEATGTITIEYNIWFSSVTRTYSGVYTPN